MRERTTWNRAVICRLASNLKLAEDPTAMNQDHIKQQPAADKYVTGDPSSFAEDVHPSTDTWKAEYSGGEVKRNEIGLPEMRNDTFNKSDKTAADEDEDEDTEDDDFLEKKAEVCLGLARRMLPKTASASSIEDQAFSLMHLPDAHLIDTVNRLASQDEDTDEEETQQQKQAQQGQQQQAEDEDKGQQKQAQQGQQQQDEEEVQQKQAQGQQQQAEDEGQGQQKQAQQDQIAQLQQQAQQIQQQIAQLQQQAQMQQQSQASQIAQAVQQAIAQGQDPIQACQALLSQGQQQQAPAQQQPVLSEEQMLDQLTQQQDIPQQVMASEFDIELEGPSIDTGIHLGSEDEALNAIFASNAEVRDATQAQALQTGIPVQASAGMSRTAATRTIGTRPSAGVSQLGGSASAGSASEIDKLAGLWQSAPDVSNVFGS